MKLPKLGPKGLRSARRQRGWMTLLMAGLLCGWTQLAYGHYLATDIRFEHLLDGTLRDETENINAVTTITQDSLGYLWFGGENGLARYNGIELEVYQKDPLNPGSITGNYVWDTLVDHQGVLWVATSQGLNRYNSATNDFSHIQGFINSSEAALSDKTPVEVLFSLALAEDDSLYVGTSEGLFRFNPQRDQFQQINSLGRQVIRELYVDSDNSLWIGTSESGLYRYDLVSQELRQWQFDAADPQSLPHNYVRAIERDKFGQLWVGTLGGGVARMADDQHTFVRFQHDSDDLNSIGSDSIWDIHSDAEGNLWFASDPGGLAQYSWQDQHFHTFHHSRLDDRSLSSDKVRVIFDDHLGDLWVGTFPNGINYFNKSTANFVNYAPRAGDDNSLSNENVTYFFEDSEGRLWIGTEGGLNEFAKESGVFHRYQADSHDPDALQANPVLAITEDDQGMLWVGTWSGGLHKFDKQQRRFTHFGSKEVPARRIADDYIWSLLFDSQQRLWVGTENEGLQLYVPEQQRFIKFTEDPKDPESLSFRHVWVIKEDSQQRIWVGTIDGLDLLLDLEGGRARFQHFRHDVTNPKSLSSNRIISLLESRDGYLWVGTQDSGVNRLDPKTGNAERLSVAHGLPSNHISSMIEDDMGEIWLTTASGVAVIDPKTFKVRVYTESNGLITNNFNRNATYKDAQGHLYFGGAKGFSVTDPTQFSNVSPPPRVVLSDLRIFNRSIYANADHSPLTQAIALTNELNLSHQDSMFALDYFAVSYRAPERNQYAYKLEGFDKQWNFVGSLHTATYTNLDPGRYVFHVRAANRDGVWSDEGRSLVITVQGPFWRTPWAYSLYGLLILGVMIFAVQYQRGKLRYQNQKLMADKLLRLDRLKDAFLANTSHELRTPLNGIIGLAETLHDGALGELSTPVKNNLKMISSSGRRLSNLINDILDYSKLNEHKLQLRTAPIGLHNLVSTVMELLLPMLVGKPIRLINDVNKDLCVFADDDRLQQILLNLVANAIKFSDRGHVRVFAEVSNNEVEISVEDTGQGIAPKDLQKVFSAFTQLDDDETRGQGGTGLGLAITKQLIELHGGNITVNSQPGIGSTFRFALPCCGLERSSEKATDATAPLVYEEDLEKLNPIVESDNDEVISLLKPAEVGSHYSILVVDDDAVNRMVLCSILSIQNYQVIEASCGNEALKIVEDNPAIDLVIMDVMMPKMSGYEACMRIRVNYPVHILPILFLTAKNFSDDLVRGFVAGGNDFLTKPVSKHELLSRVSTHLCLLDINRRLEEKYQQACDANVHNYKELRTLEHIVDIINREMDFRVLLRDLLQGVQDLTEADETIYWQAGPSDEQRYTVLAGDIDGLNEVCLHDGDKITRHLDDLHRDGCSILILDDMDSNHLDFIAESFPGLVSSVLMTIYFERTVVGFITVLSFNEQKRFGDEDVCTLNRIHAHVTSAVVKAKLLEKIGLNEMMNQ